MASDTLSPSGGADAAMLADLALLTPDPAGLGALLAQLGYRPTAYANGLFAPGLDDPGRHKPLVLLFPLYSGASLAARDGGFAGRHVDRSGTIAAGLAALRSVDRRPALLFLASPHPPPAAIQPEWLVSLEGGVVPRIWRRCFGSFDVLARLTGQRPHPGLTNTAVNAIETSVPILQSLLHLKSDIQARSIRWGHFADAPLRPRLTISAAHGGSRGSLLPVMFDLLLTRRYDPAELMQTALGEIRTVMAAAAPGTVQVDVSVTHHDTPLPDPDLPNRSREERALAAGWGWPQTRFSTTSQLVPGAAVLGGLERPDHDTETGDSFVTPETMGALARTVRVLLLAS